MSRIISLGYEPNPRQAEFFRSRVKHTAYGGARGGGKSWAMRTKLVMLAARYAGIQCLLLRRTFPELRENHIVPMLQLLGGVARYKAQDKVFEFCNGSRIVLGYCSNELDALQYQGQSYDVIGFEEATQFTEAQYHWVISSLRPTVGGFAPRAYYTCNPGGVGHAWVKRLFIDRDFRASEKPEDYAFIPARVTDNYVLMSRDPDYVGILESLPEDMRRAHLYGDWDVFAGQYYPEFNRDIHVIEPFAIPSHWRRYRAMDYGLDMCAVVWAAMDAEKNVYVYRELHKPDLPISSAVAAIDELTPEGEDIYSTLAPPDLWHRTQETGKQKADLFRECGLRLTKTSNDREAGWLAIKELLQAKEDRPPKLRIFSTCQTLIKHLPMLQRDTKRPTDAATEPHEITHICDALRAFAIWWSRPGAEPEPDMTDRVVWPDDIREDYRRADDTGKAEIIKIYGKPRYF